MSIAGSSNLAEGLVSDANRTKMYKNIRPSESVLPHKNNTESSIVQNCSPIVFVINTSQKKENVHILSLSSLVPARNNVNTAHQSLTKAQVKKYPGKACKTEATFDASKSAESQEKKDLDKKVQEMCKKIIKTTKEKRRLPFCYQNNSSMGEISPKINSTPTDEVSDIFESVGAAAPSSDGNISAVDGAPMAEANKIFEGDETAAPSTDDSFSLMDALSSDGPYSCPLCDYCNAKRYMVVRHMRSHSEDRPFNCTMCERKFKSAIGLKNHTNTHTGDRPQQCTLCEARFTTSGELVRHVRYRHTLEKPHKCSYCDYASVELSKLKRHLRSHTQERPFVCPECQHSFYDSGALKRHARVHSGMKPYACSECPQKFAQSNSLKKHLKIHKGLVKPGSHPCAQCPTSFSWPRDLAAHLCKFHAVLDPPATCPACPAMFGTFYDFKVHAKLVHKRGRLAGPQFDVHTEDGQLK